MRSHGPWKIKKTSEIYQDSFVHCWQDDVIRPDGNDGQHVVVAIKPGVCVLALDEENNAYLTDEFHYAIGRDSLEAVSGGIEPGEEPDETAIRELKEELGLHARQLEYLTTIDPFTSIMVSPTQLYFATQLSETTANPEGTELIERKVMPITECNRLVQDGTITHAPTCILVMIACQRISND